MDLSELFDTILKTEIAIDIFCFLYCLNLIRFHNKVRSLGISTYNYYKIKEMKANKEDLPNTEEIKMQTIEHA